MKKKLLTLLLAFVAIATTGRAQVALNATNFPDANFRKALAEILGVSEGSEITKAKIAATTSLDVSNKSIADLTGIEHFTALKVLNCMFNQLASLDVSKNIALTYLSCENNQLTSFDVLKNTKLINLYCYNNQLTSLDVSKNTALTTLTCYNNPLISLDVSKNTALTTLTCSNNQLTSLDVSKNTMLTHLRCYRNQVKGKEMNALVASLPSVENGEFFVIITQDENEGNVCTKAQVAVAKGKGWTVYAWSNSDWQEYEGSEDATPSLKVEPTEIDFGVVESGSSKTKTFTVTNTGKSNLTFYADACTEFTYSFDVSDNQTNVTLAPGASKTYTVTAHGMSAGYEAATNILIKIDGVTEDQKVKLKVFGDDDQPLIDKTSLKMVVGEKASVKIKTGSVSAIPDDDNIVDWIGGGPGTTGGPIACKDYDSSISHQQMGITLTALKVGVVHITFTDMRTNKTATLTVTVTDGSSDESGWHLVTDSGEKFPMSRVGMLVAVDESAYFSVLDINGNVLADEVLRVHFVESDPVGIENLTTEKSQNILKRYVNNELTLVGAKGTVNVYSVDGVKVAMTYAAGQETIINVSSLPSGVYIVKCGNQSFKFNKK